MIHLTTISSPIGPITVAARDALVCLTHFGADGPPVRRALQRAYPGETIELHENPAGAVERLHAYFRGELHALDGIAVDLTGTPFQKRVWTALRTIEPGTTKSYSAIARQIGAPSAVRAVGAANGANPVAIIVPCHRVIGADGSLTGYGGGIGRKRWLLNHERAAPDGSANSLLP